MARYFTHRRGTAIAVGSLGMAIGEALLPFVVVLLISVIGWRLTYFSSSLFILIFLFPIIIILLNNYQDSFFEKNFNASNKKENVNGQKPFHSKSFTRTEVLKDFRFYLMTPGLMAPGIILTALFFHHLNIADNKGWSHFWITGNYFIYSISVSFIAIFIGALIDKFSAKILVIFSLIPLIVSLLLISFSWDPYIVIIYMFFLGASSGFTYTSHPAIIAEMYGIKYLGSIKSLLSALTVFGSAIGPVIFGGLMDLNFRIETILIYFTIYSVISTFLFIFALQKKYNYGY
jgi:MFS family permease